MRESKLFIAAVTILVIGVLAMLVYDPTIFAVPNHTPRSVYRYDPSVYLGDGVEHSGVEESSPEQVRDSKRSRIEPNR